jgi:hypothetical protein
MIGVDKNSWEKGKRGRVKGKSLLPFTLPLLPKTD